MGEELHAAIGVEGKGRAGQGRVDKIGVAWSAGEGLSGEVVEAHGRFWEEAALDGSAHKDEEAGVAWIAFDG